MTVKKKAAIKKKNGRPTRYTIKMGDALCAELAQGVSLRTACKNPLRPSISTVFNWFSIHDKFLEQYTRAKQESADALTDEMIDIADNGENDYMEKLGKDGRVEGYIVNGEHIQRSRLRIETRKWLASKLKPKKYGDKITQDVTISEKVTDNGEEQF